MKTLITQPHSRMRSLGSRWLAALVTLCCIVSAAPAIAQGNWYVGAGTSIWSQTNTVPGPLGFYQGAGRTQWIYKASELVAAGIPANTSIHQIAFNVRALQNSQGANNSAAPNFTLRIQATNLSTLNSSNFVNVGFTSAPTGYTIQGSYEPGLGWNTFNLPSGGLLWNGTDNIVIDIAYNTGFNSTNNTGNGFAGVVYHSQSSTGGPWGVYYNTNSGSTDPRSTAISPTSTTLLRPNIRFTSMTPCVNISRRGVLNYPATNTGICPGTRLALIDTNYGSHINVSFQWLSSNSATGPWTRVAGATSDRYTTQPLTAPIFYRLAQSCSFGGVDTTPAIGFTPSTSVTYATIPYSQSFETWSNGCGTNDKVDASWTNIPFTGNASRRRDDQGSSATWGSTLTTVPLKAKDGQYSSRYNYYHTGAITTGNEFSLHLDCSGSLGTKELRFWYAFTAPVAAINYDSLSVDISNDSGRTFAPISATSSMNNYAGTPGAWNYVTYPINSNRPGTIVRFRSRTISVGSAPRDVLIDAVEVVPPCTGKPVAGKIDTAEACEGKSVTLYTTGTSKNAGLTYSWQSRPLGSTFPWAPMPAGTGPSVTTTVVKAPIEVRLVVGCGNTTPVQTDTSATYILKPAPFYYCYCNNVTFTYSTPPTTSNSYVLLGNVTLRKEPAGTTDLINNGNPLPTFMNTTTPLANMEDFRRTVPAPDLVLDSSYRLLTTYVSGSSSSTYAYNHTVTAWIDFNQDGTFDPVTERVMYRSIGSGWTNPTSNQVFRVPAAAKVGLTGMRVMITMYNSPTPTPCGTQTSNYGQMEDYLVNIQYQPCTGPASAGQTGQSDTSVCPGYTVDLWNTTYQKDRTGIVRAWEVSTNGGASFSTIANSADKDSMINVLVGKATSSKYRLRLICSHTNDTTYSNVVTVTTPAPYRCYPTSWAGVGNADSSDIGTVILGNFMNPAPGIPAGPHLLNPLATKRRTDYTVIPPISLFSDSTYRLAVFHTMPRAWHADAMVSVFFDYNNDGDYDVSVPGAPFTSELALQGISEYDSFFLDTKIKIPSAVIPNVPTGMRVVINNDLNPNGPGNIGSGAFVSGEVEDYVVIFNRVNVGVNGPSLLNNVGVFPNPTDGRFTILNDAARAVSHMDIVVTTVSGQEVIRRSFDNVGTHFTTSLDLSAQAKGMYFVEIRADGEKVTKKLVVR